jgi:16S rRNA processing protein RimM
MEEYILIGHTKKTHGARGELKVFIKDFYLQDFLQTDVIFLTISGKPVPFFVENISSAGASLILKLEDIDSPDAAKPFTAKEIQLRKSDLVPDEERLLEEEDSGFERYRGYMARDLEKGEIGEIAEMVEMPGQLVALVYRGAQKIMIPFHDSLIHHIDKTKRTITFQLPEGLLDL